MCKYEYIMYYKCHQHDIDDGKITQIKFGVNISCAKCGKENKRLGKKISKIIANSYKHKELTKIEDFRGGILTTYSLKNKGEKR